MNLQLQYNFVTLIAILYVLISVSVNCENCINRNATTRKESLDPNGGYDLEWSIDELTTIITFDATVRTTGFVGFGLSYYWGMFDSDIVIGGIFPNGTTYFKDRHGAGWFRPVSDEIQNWNLLSVLENSTHTNICFSRLLDTGDVLEDVAITNNTINLVWSFGATDDIVYHIENRGKFPVQILE